MGDEWKGEILFSTAPGKGFKKAKLTIKDSIEIEKSLAFGLLRASYRAELRDLLWYSRNGEMLELQLRTKSGSSQTWFIKTPQVEMCIALFQRSGVQEKQATIQIISEQKTQLPTEQAAKTVFSVKLALYPGRWMSAKINLTSESLRVEALELFGMMPRPLRVKVELNALKSFSRSDSDLIKLQIESKPGYGLGDEWIISTKQREELARALLNLGVKEVQSS
ncbi:MAG: hypothetical protein ACUVTL_09960 [Thermoproteota archaeon]